MKRRIMLYDNFKFCFVSYKNWTVSYLSQTIPLNPFHKNLVELFCQLNSYWCFFAGKIRQHGNNLKVIFYLLFRFSGGNLIAENDIGNILRREWVAFDAR